MSQSSEEHVQGFLPLNKVLTILETKVAAAQAVVALTAAGFPEAEITVYHGEQDEKFLDLDGSHSNFLHKLMRSYQRLQGIEKRMLDDAEAAIKAGYYLVGIQTDGSEEEQVKGRDALRGLTNRRIYFCGRFAITVLEFAEAEQG